MARPMVWARTVDHSIVIAANTLRAIDLMVDWENAVGRQMGDFTVTRMLINQSVRPDVIAASFDALIGVIIAPEGGVGVPDPETAIDSDWLLWDTYLKSNDSRSMDGGTVRQVPWTKSYDVRSQRKVRSSGASLWYVTKNSDAANAITVSFSAQVLCKLA